MPGIGFHERCSSGAKVLLCHREGCGREIHNNVLHLALPDVSQQWAFTAAQLQDRLVWPKLSRGHEGRKTCRPVLQAELLEQTKPLTSKAAMPVFQVHVRGVHQAVLS